MAVQEKKALITQYTTYVEFSVAAIVSPEVYTGTVDRAMLNLAVNCSVVSLESRMTRFKIFKRLKLLKLTFSFFGPIKMDSKLPPVYFFVKKTNVQNRCGYSILFFTQ